MTDKCYLTSERNKKLLEELPNPKRLWHWFLWATEIPRGSGHTEKIRAALLSVCEEHGWKAHADDAGNVIAFVPGTSGREHDAAVCLQSHMDIVNAQDRADYNPLTDGVEVRRRDGVLCAHGTSLGGDDGAGIATALALMEEGENAPHPPTVLLFTNDEETTTDGAIKLSSDALGENVKYLINLDSEESGKLCLACAGSLDCIFNIPIKRIQKDSLDKDVKTETYQISVSGLRGGHSGCDIHVGIANALKVIAALLHGLDFSLVSICSGSALNAIPRDASAVVCISENGLEEVKKRFEVFKEEYASVEERPILSVKKAETELMPCDEQSTKKIIYGLTLLPSNPLRISPDNDDLVETSYATTIAETHENEIVISALARTSRESQFEEIKRISESLAFFMGGRVCYENHLPAWNYLETELSRVSEEVYEKLTAKKAIKYGIHAFLECGLIVEKYPKCQAISIGPTVRNAHSCQEEIDIDSCDEFYAWVKGIIEELH